MFTQEAIATAARTYLGVPWHHAGRSRAGLDCIGLVVCSMKDCGIEVDDVLTYTLNDEFALLIEKATQHADVIDSKEMAPGDVIIFRSRLMYNHCGIYLGDNKFIHADRTVRVVNISRLDDAWSRRISVIFRVRSN